MTTKVIIRDDGFEVTDPRFLTFLGSIREVEILYNNIKEFLDNTEEEK